MYRLKREIGTSLSTLPSTVGRPSPMDDSDCPVRAGVSPVMEYGVSRRRCRITRRGIRPTREWVCLCGRYPKRGKLSLRQSSKSGKTETTTTTVSRSSGGFGVWTVRWSTNPHTTLHVSWERTCSDVPPGHHSTGLVRLRKAPWESSAQREKHAGFTRTEPLSPPAADQGERTWPSTGGTGNPCAGMHNVLAIARLLCAPGKDPAVHTATPLTRKTKATG
jgi:hypothetical protein